MQACHEAITTVKVWCIDGGPTQLECPGMSGPLAQAEADHVDWHQTPDWSGAAIGADSLVGTVWW
jgi:hypothetical protein